MKKTMRRFVAVLLTFMLITGVGVQSYGAETSVTKDNSVQATEEQQIPAKDEAKAEDTDVEKEAAAEATEATEATKAKDATEKTKMPAQDFKGSAGGINVSVSAPEGAFPEGTKMSLKGVSNAKAIDMLDGDVDGIVDAKGVDFTFTYKGKEIEPEKKISVKFTGANLEGDEFDIYHVADNGKVEKVSSNANANGGTFKADEFSVYLVGGWVLGIPYDGTELTNGTTLVLKVGEHEYVKSASVGEYSNEWSSPDSSIASIRECAGSSGLWAIIEAKAEGEVWMTHTYKVQTGFLKYETRTEQFKVVIVGNADSISIDGPDYVVEGSNIQLSATLSPTGSVGTVEWASSDTSTATVDAQGNVTGIVPGQVTITATLKGRDDITPATKVITVTPKTVTLTYIDGSPISGIGGQIVPGTKVTLPTAEQAGITHEDAHTLIGWTEDVISGRVIVNKKKPEELLTTFYPVGSEFTVTKDTDLRAVWGKQVGELVTTGYEGKYDGQTHVAAAVVNDAPAGANYVIQYKVDGQWTTKAPSIRDAGENTYDVQAISSKPNKYETLTGTVTLKVTQREITLTSVNAQKEFDLLPLYARQVTVGGDGFVGREGIRTYGFASQLEPGSTDNTFKYIFKRNTNPANYNVTKVEYGKLTVTNPNFGTIIVKGQSKEYVYDGTIKEFISTKVDYDYIPSASGILGELEKVAFYAAADVIGGSVSVPGLNAGDYDVTATPVSVRIKLVGTDITDCYKILYEKGTMTILPRPVTLTSATDSKMYDGSPLTNNNVTVGGDGFVLGQGVSKYTVTGSQTDVGSSPNEFTYKLNILTNANNYNITKKEGTLTVTPSDKLTVTGTSYDKPYDGQEHGDAAVPSVTNGTTVKYSTDNGANWSTDVPKIKNVGTINVKVKAENSNYVTATAQYTLEVTPRDVTVRAMDAGKVYGDSEPADFVTKSTGTIVPDEVDFTVTREPGEDVGTYTITPSGAEVQGNYKVKYETGTFTITEKELTVTTESKNKEYDGDELTAPGTISGFVNNETATFTVTGSQIEVGKSKNTYTITWDGTAKESNYKITEKVGTLEVTPYTGTVTVSVVGGNYTYDGQAHEAKVKVTGLPKGYRVDTATSYGDATHVAEGTITAECERLVVKNAQDEVVYEYNREEEYDPGYEEDPGYRDPGYEPEIVSAGVTAAANTNNLPGIVFNTGSIKINPAPVKVTTDSATKTYDGTALKAKAHMKGLVNGETATVKATGSRTEVGSSKNTYKITWETAQQTDYAVTDKLGTLTVNGAPAAAAPAAVTPPDDPAGTAQATTTIEDGDTPLANVTVEDVCHILPFLLMLAALIVLIAYTSSMKRRQEEIFALKEEIAARKARR